MHRGNTGPPSSLSERLRSFSNRYSNNPDGNADDNNGGFRPTSVSNRKYERERGDSVEKEGSPGFESGVTRGSYGRTREGSSGRGADGSERGSYYGSTSSLSSSSGRYYGIQERATPASNGHGPGLGSPSGDGHPGRLSSKREAREAFFTKQQQEMAAPKFDPSLLRERERGDKEHREKEKMAYSGTTGGHGPAGGQGPGSKEIEGYVGFANLPNQVYRKSVKRGFEFTLMVVGESGLGKSTLINSMFLADLYSADYPGPSHRIKKTVNAEPTQVLLKEGGVQLRLTVVDTPGFGDAVDNSNCWQPVIEYIENKYDEYLNAESRVNRKTMPDNRVHCCLYFISPNGHGLKPLDVEFMKRLHDKVNIIPLIAKADTLTPDECREFKKTILNEIAQHKIKIYEFPDADDEEENKLQKKLKDRVPFAVVGSNIVVEVQGRKVRGRMYPWGIVEVENLEHNDFIALRNMLIRTYLQDLKDVTNNVHYENFRYNKLASVTSGGKNKNTSGKGRPSDAVRDATLAGCTKKPPTAGAPVPAVRRRRNKLGLLGTARQSRFSSSLSHELDLQTAIRQWSYGNLVDNVPTSPRTPPSPRSPRTPQSPQTPSYPQSPMSSYRSMNEYHHLNGHTEVEPNSGQFSSHTLPKRPPRSKSKQRGSAFNIHQLSDPDKNLAPLENGLSTHLVAFSRSMSNEQLNPMIMMEDERRDHVAKMKKMEAEMEQVFEMKVKEKKHKLKDSELDLQRRAEQMKKSLEQQQKELEEKRRAFEKERAMWEEQQRQLEEQRRRSLENAKDNAKKDKKKSLF